MDLAAQLESLEVVGHWDFVYDYDEGGYVCGQFLALSDRTVLIRMGGSSSKGDGKGNWSTTWRYGDWELYMHWNGEVNAAAVVQGLKNRGYGLTQPSPVAPDQTGAGPVDGIPDLAKYL